MRNPLLSFSFLLKTKLDKGALLPLMLQHRDVGFVLYAQSTRGSLNPLLRGSLHCLLCALLFDLHCFEVGVFPFNLWLWASAISWLLWEWALYFCFLFFLPLDSFGEEKGEVLILCPHSHAGSPPCKIVINIFKMWRFWLLLLIRECETTICF